MRRANSIVAALAAIALMTSSCCSEKDQLNKAGGLLQKAQDSVDNWGRISISDLLLVENTGQFKISYDEDASNYVNAARNTLAGTSFASQASF